VKIKRVHHLGIIVGDLDDAVRSFTEHLGLKLDHVEQYGDELDIAFLPCGETLLELIKPRTDQGSNADYLKENGPGIQHAAFEVDNIDAALKELDKRGVKALGDAPMPGAGGTRIAFLDPQAFGGILVELCEPITR
jgi:methylmalonyl-CoA/ethylmalonyl-CoA epimerase